MSQLQPFSDGGYSFVPGGPAHAQSVRAADGYAIERARFTRPLPLQKGFAAIEAHLKRSSRPLTALCAAELRCPKQFTMNGFEAFNMEYGSVLERWGLLRAGLNPVSRSNVAPLIDPPSEPSFYAFCYTVPSTDGKTSFVASGSAEWPEGTRFPDDIVARGDVSAAGIAAKARCVLDAMDRRMSRAGVGWKDVTGTQVYTVENFLAVLAEQILPLTGNSGGVTWHYTRPPIEELDFEIDVRGVATERVIAV